MTTCRWMSSLAALVAWFVPHSASAQQGWAQQSPANHPPALIDPNMAYDSLNQQVVLFSGTTSNGVTATTPSDTWLWDGHNWTITSPAHKPPGRLTGGIAYDEAHHQVVIFGGATEVLFGDTWVWDGSDWTQKFPTVSPPARDSTAMAYDAARQQVVLFGGETKDGTLQSDTWI